MALPRQLPNLITGGRLLLAVALFVLLTALLHAQEATAVALAAGPGVGPDAAAGGPLAGLALGRERLLLNVSLAIFVAAGISDILDGQIARRWGLQTDFGRIVDPFADKVVVCGVFVLLVPLQGAQVSPWMVVVILARELLVDGLRGFAEAKGVAFPAIWSGKAKMLLQSVCLGWILFTLANLPAAPWAARLAQALLAATLAVTVVSGAQYVLHAWRGLRAGALGALTAGQVQPGAASPAPAGAGAGPVGP